MAKRTPEEREAAEEARIVRREASHCLLCGTRTKRPYPGCVNWKLCLKCERTEREAGRLK